MPAAARRHPLSSRSAAAHRHSTAHTVEDRFNNWVRYEWNGDRLERIHANDGRELIIHYRPNGTIETVTAGAGADTRVWTYVYALNGSLSEAINPDGSRWQYSVDFDPQIQYLEDPDPWPNGPVIKDKSIHCSWQRVIDTTDNRHRRTLSITHPSGAHGQFTFEAHRHGRHNVPLDCLQSSKDQPSDLDWNRYALVQDVFSLVEKRVTGPGLPTPGRVWTYEYAELGAGYNQAAGFYAGPVPGHTKRVTVIEPDGAPTVYAFGKDYGLNEGQLLSVQVKASGQGPVLRTTHNDHISETDVGAAAFPSLVGSSLVGFSDPFAAAALRPVRLTTIQQNGVDFGAYTAAWNPYARPTQVVRSSSLPVQPNSKTELTTYANDTHLWLIGRVATVKDQSTGAVMVDNRYRSDGLLEHRYAFGRRIESYDYHPQDGTLKTVVDGRNNVTTLSQWYRGVPRRIDFPSQTSRQAGVNPFGEIVWIANELGQTTHYGYDAAGRLTLIDPPDESNQVWDNTSISYSRADGAAYGLPVGHWVREEARGKYRKQTHYDAYWRPVIEREFEYVAPDTSRLDRYRHWRYDLASRLSFEAYPVSSASSPASFPFGTHHAYDALGRPTSIGQDSEHGRSTTAYAYLAGFQTRVTNPRGKIVTTSFQAFDNPDSASPILIQKPEGVATTIARDVFGKPLGITRSGTFQGQWQSLTRHFVYDSHQRLCKRIDPEQGATVFQYDAADNLEWSADGLNLPSTGTCNHANVPVGQRVTRSYDSHNRPTAIAYPDSADDIAMTYYADGALHTAHVGTGASAIQRTYQYNNRRLPTSEQLVLDGQSFNLGYRYDAQGSLREIGYPDGGWESLNPDAFGRATAMGQYASDASYHPAGAIAGFDYGNGVRFSQQLNLRHMPAARTLTRYATPIQQNLYQYDPNGNLTSDTDTVGTYYDFRNASRTMQYDALDRLTVANSPSQIQLSHQWGFSWGYAIFTYDALDNIRRGELGPIDFHYQYNANNRLSHILSHDDPDPPFYFSYNARGQMTSRVFKDDIHTLAWDSAHRLLNSSNTSTGTTEHYRYDAHGHRARTQHSNGLIAWQVYSQSGQLLFERNNWGQTTKYGYLAGTLVGEVRNGQRRAVHTDLVGTVRAITDALGTVVLEDVRAPYGSTLLGWSYRNGPAFAGHIEDASTGLTYMKARYYDPVAMRFLSPDPVDVDTTTSGTNFNRYWYANNNPYTFVDPDGRWPSQKGFYVHQAAIERVIGPHVSKAELAVLKRSQAIADAKQYQGGDSSFRHAMRSGNQTVAEARAMANQFVRSQFEKAWSAPTREQALIEFGVGLHALQDATSPAHTGFQQWTGEETWGETLGHIRSELYDPGAGSSLDGVTQQAWGAFQKGKLPKGDLFGGGFQGVFRVEGRIDSRRLGKELEGK